MDICPPPHAQDPYSFGAYSYVPPNGKKSYYDCLGHPGGLSAELHCAACWSGVSAAAGSLSQGPSLIAALPTMMFKLRPH